MPVINWTELRECGWTRLYGVSDQAELLRVARLVGQPVCSPTGELVKELVPRPTSDARNGTLSESYGRGAFPLHTDTAFWPVPARYVIFRARGDVRRQTTILTFNDLFRGEYQKLLEVAERSVWIAKAASKSAYCSMKFSIGGQGGFRYDGQCMRPANAAALLIRDALVSILSYDRAEPVDWENDVAIVVDNWQALHARGPSPVKEGPRVLERVYVT